MTLNILKSQQRVVENNTASELASHIAKWYGDNLMTGTHRTILDVNMRTRTEANLDLTPCSVIPDAILLPDIPTPSWIYPNGTYSSPDNLPNGDYFEELHTTLPEDGGQLYKVELEVRRYYELADWSVMTHLMDVEIYALDSPMVTNGEFVIAHSDRAGGDAVISMFTMDTSVAPNAGYSYAMRFRYMLTTGQISDWSDVTYAVIVGNPPE
jgi:hypothetical protein